MKAVPGRPAALSTGAALAYWPLVPFLKLSSTTGWATTPQRRSSKLTAGRCPAAPTTWSRARSIGSDQLGETPSVVLLEKSLCARVNRFQPFFRAEADPVHMK